VAAPVPPPTAAPTPTAAVTLAPSAPPSLASPARPVPAAPIGGAAEDAAVRKTVEDYARAIQARDIELFRLVKPNLSADEEKRLRAIFKQYKSYKVSIAVSSIRIEGSEAKVRVSRQDTIDGNPFVLQQVLTMARDRSAGRSGDRPAVDVARRCCTPGRRRASACRATALFNFTSTLKSTSSLPAALNLGLTSYHVEDPVPGLMSGRVVTPSTEEKVDDCSRDASITRRPASMAAVRRSNRPGEAGRPDELVGQLFFSPVSTSPARTLLPFCMTQLKCGAARPAATETARNGDCGPDPEVQLSPWGSARRPQGEPGGASIAFP
jgi:hypothetical protein